MPRSGSWKPSSLGRALTAYAQYGSARELRNPALKGLRLWPVNDTVRVIRILHGKRDVDRILKKESGDNASRTRNNRDRPPSCLTHVLGAASLGGFEVIIDGPF